MTLSLILALLLSQSTAAEPVVWHIQYERGLRLIEQGDAKGAREAFRAALTLRPAEGLQIPARPMQYVDYLPHLYLAITSQMLGEIDEARRHLAEAERSGVAAKSELGRPLLIAYQQLLRGNLTAKYERPRFAVFPQRETVLSQSQFDQLASEVMARCDVPVNSKLAEAPWYTHYELGLEVERKGDPQRALNLFLEAINRRPNPQRRARMYGMWLIDYYPYFHMARSHRQLGNWECAKDALEISTKLKEITPQAPEYSEFQALKQELERRATTP